MKKILFICRKQFGYSIDNYYHCKYLKNHYKITYLSPKTALDLISMANVNTIYVDFNSNHFENNIRFLLKCIIEARKPEYDIVIINRFHFCFLLALLRNNQEMILDIRSGIILNKPLQRKIQSYFLKFETLFFRNISIISESLSASLNLDKANVLILPVGSEVISIKPKWFDHLTLFYIGTFTNRNIEMTLRAFSKFYKEYSTKIRLSYIIVGFGEGQQTIKEYIIKEKLGTVVRFLGRKRHEDLEEVFNSANIGVSFIPITSYYDVQPPTKTFEYLCNGMVVLATATTEHTKVINDNNGVLINDTEDGFYQGLVEIYNNRKKYNSMKIASDSEIFHWKSIVETRLKPYIDSIIW